MKFTSDHKVQMVDQVLGGEVWIMVDGKIVLKVSYSDKDRKAIVSAAKSTANIIYRGIKATGQKVALEIG